MKPGDVFRLVKGADRHAKVVISDPAFPGALKVLFVGMTSWDSREDQSCILDVGDHSTVVHRTCIAYSRANAKTSNADLDAMVKANLIELLEPVSGDVLKRIRDGAMKSNRTPKDCKKILVDQAVVADANRKSAPGPGDPS
jgi:hypothetical protein